MSCNNWEKVGDSGWGYRINRQLEKGLNIINSDRINSMGCSWKSIITFIPENKLYAKIYCKSSGELNFDKGEAKLWVKRC